MQVVEIHRDQLHWWEFGGQLVNALPETRRHRARAARALWKDDQRAAGAQRHPQWFERIDGRILLGAVDEHRAQRARGDIALDPLTPVVERRDGVCRAA